MSGLKGWGMNRAARRTVRYEMEALNAGSGC